jgi:hypothetical protein
MIFIYILAAILILLLIVAASLPSKYHVEKSVIISRPVAAVKEKVTDLGNYAKWNPWQQMDPAASKRITGNPGAPGHRYEWEGKKVGAGSLTLKDNGNHHASFDLEFRRPWKAKARDSWSFEDWGDNGTKVTWQNSGNLPFPTARLMGPMLNKNLNKQFVTGLDNLKKMCEEC